MIMDYFKLAVELTRAEAAPTLARVAQKQIAFRLVRNDSKEVCCCSAYNFPHRSGGGNCPAPAPIRYTTDPRPAWEAEERALFDANEARSINAGNAG